MPPSDEVLVECTTAWYNATMVARYSLKVGRVQRFCLKDGPGIRTTVFLQGCPLHCWWCHNADLQTASSSSARTVHADGLAEELMRDARYWARSGGGVTLSGGEPLQQADACAALLRQLGERGVHRCVDTSGAAEPRAVAALAPHTDLWLYDLKTMDAAACREATDGELEPMLQNLRTLVARDARKIRIRMPLIRGFNTARPALEAIGRFLGELDRSLPLDILPGHDVNRPDGPPATVSRAQCEEAERILRQHVPCTEVCW